MADNFTVAEERSLRRAILREGDPPCPRCGGRLDLTRVPPRPEVAYVRDRVLIQCSSCKLKGVVDRR
ncbi:MAG: hypothetical protein ACWGSQ_03735 [Longimicrobiales bacterium]